MVLTVGCTYLATQDAYSFNFEGVEQVFDKVEKQIKVLDKPKRVILDDGITKEETDLPNHLKSENWYFALNLKTNKTFWFSSEYYDVKLIHNDTVELAKKISSLFPQIPTEMEFIQVLKQDIPDCKILSLIWHTLTDHDDALSILYGSKRANK